MTRARKTARPSKPAVPRTPPSPAPATPAGAPELLADLVSNRALFVAWLDRMRNEVHWVQDELERDGPVLRGVLPEDDRRRFVHELDMMWTTLTQVMPLERPPEFRRKGGAL